jgi:luciferase family oxidoreductase group 1
MSSCDLDARLPTGPSHRFLSQLIQLSVNSGLAVSVLDLVGMRTGELAGNAIARSVDLAQHVEQWGYKRYWLAEHHSISGLACSATPVLIGHVAGSTKTIRVGSGGVMLPNHAPVVVAEQFGTLEALYPGRIDLGLGRAPGGDFQTMRALRRDSQQSGDDFPLLLQELRGYLGPENRGKRSRRSPDREATCRSHCWGRADSARSWLGCWGCHLHSRRTLLPSTCT